MFSGSLASISSSLRVLSGDGIFLMRSGRGQCGCRRARKAATSVYVAKVPLNFTGWGTGDRPSLSLRLFGQLATACEAPRMIERLCAAVAFATGSDMERGEHLLCVGGRRVENVYVLKIAGAGFDR